MEDALKLLRQIGLDENADHAPEQIVATYHERLEQYKQGIANAGSKAERRIAKATLAEFEAIGQQVTQFSNSRSVEIHIQRAREFLLGEKPRKALLSVDAATKILQSSDLYEAFKLELDELRIDVEEALAEQSSPDLAQSSLDDELLPDPESPVADADTIVEVDDESEHAVSEPTDCIPETPDPVPDAEVLSEVSDAPQAVPPEPAVVEPVAEQAPELPSLPPLEADLHADCFTLTGPDGELLHVLALPTTTFGRNRDCNVMVRAYIPDQESERIKVTRMISRTHFTITRQQDDVLLESGGWVEGKRKPAPNGVFADGQLIDQIQLFRTGVQTIRLLQLEHTESPPSWQIDLRMVPASDTCPSVDLPTVSGPQALLLKRMDGLCEDILLLWGSVNMADLQLTDAPLWLIRSHQGFFYSDSNCWQPLAPDSELNALWRVYSHGKLVFSE